MKKYCLYLIFSLLLTPAFVSHAGQGKIIGEDSYTIPGWFKDNFLEIQWDEHTIYSEKTLAAELKVHFTPSLIFLNSAGEKVFQMNGYRNPSAFLHVLNYVKDKQYLNTPLADYVRPQDESIYTLQSHPQFKDVTNFSQFKGPLAIIFEDRSYADCDEFHKEVLMHEDVMKELQGFTLVRLDALSAAPLIDIDGNISTAQE